MILEENKNISKEISHLYRHEYGKLVSTLTGTFGSTRMELAEDVVQEAMLEAITKWAYNGVPENPVGWIYKVAKYKATNILKREKYKREYDTQYEEDKRTEWMQHNLSTNIFTQKEIEDDQLRMIFTCCHPSISSDSQVALTLKTLCGFSISEIAKAFLTSEENINKRLVRARKTIRKANIPFEVPVGSELQKRISGVHQTIYLLFNEGYSASHGNKIIRLELCEEALRLTQILISNPNLIKTSNSYALLALMSLNMSRFKSRLDNSGNIVPLEHQNRGDWDQLLIQQGLQYLEYAAQQNEVSIYHILATISAQYCTAKTYQSTDWQSILELYDLLIRIDRSPIIILNRAIVLSKTADPRAALAELEKIKDKASILTYLPFYTAKAELHYLNKEYDLAICALDEASLLPTDQNLKAFIAQKRRLYQRSK